MGARQNPGDFIAYRKSEDTECPFRIAFVQVNVIYEDLKDVHTKKIKLITTKNRNNGRIGVAIQNKQPQWFDGFNELITFHKYEKVLPLNSNYMELIQKCKRNQISLSVLTFV